MITAKSLFDADEKVARDAFKKATRTGKVDLMSMNDAEFDFIMGLTIVTRAGRTDEQALEDFRAGR